MKIIIKIKYDEPYYDLVVIYNLITIILFRVAKVTWWWQRLPDQHSFSEPKLRTGLFGGPPPKIGR